MIYDTDIFIWDNLNLKIFGELFSGIYKVNSVEYNVDPGSFTTSLEAFQLIRGKRAYTKIKDPREIEFKYFKPEEGIYPDTYSTLHPGEVRNPALDTDLSKPLIPYHERRNREQ